MRSFIFIKKNRLSQVIQQLTGQIILMLFAVSVSGMILFIYCYYGKQATDSYAAFAMSLYQMAWTNLPNDLQKYFIFMIANAQKEVSYRGFGLVKLNLETFTTVNDFYRIKVKLFVQIRIYLHVSDNEKSHHILFNVQSIDERTTCVATL